ncbi:MAG: TonB-dependent receptor [Vicinamibacterales bacterium]
MPACAISTSGIPDRPRISLRRSATCRYSDALAASTTVDAAASFTGNTQAPWLPYLGGSYEVSPALTVYANYGRNYARSQGYPELMQTYLSARAAYTAAGADMQYLYDRFRLATSNNYEAGLRLNVGWLYLAPSYFTADYRNKLLTVYDPAINRGIRQAVGRARSSGFELEAGANPLGSLSLYGSLSVQPRRAARRHHHGREHDPRGERQTDA